MAAFGAEEGWDEEVGLKAEIVPLTRPFGLYAGNVFQGVVKFKGKPVANVDVEVEFWNADKKVTAPNEYFFTQVVKTDKNGVFTFAVPKAGWWGFSALNWKKRPWTRRQESRRGIRRGDVGPVYRLAGRKINQEGISYVQKRAA